MAVGQARTTRSRRNQRRSHDRVTKPTLSIDRETGEVHRRHHLTADGYYRGHQYVVAAASVDETEE
jgi:large subunit ribosomal protein L32